MPTAGSTTPVFSTRRLVSSGGETSAWSTMARAGTSPAMLVAIDPTPSRMPHPSPGLWLGRGFFGLTLRWAVVAALASHRALQGAQMTYLLQVVDWTRWFIC